jgi:transcriptional regulator with XRE-family HTH domain
MRRKEENFTPPFVQERAEKWGRRILAERLERNMTQAAAAERARMSKFTWLKLEKGDVSVSMGAWLTAMDILGLLKGLELPEAPPPAPAAPKQRVRLSTAKTKRFDF